MSKGRPTKQFELYIDGKYVITGNMDEISKIVGLTRAKLYKRVKREMSGVMLKPVDTSKQVYAFYKGVDGPFIGTISEISEMTGIQQHMIKWYSTPSAMERFDTALIKLEDDEMITRRTINKVAPVPVPEKYEPVKKEKIYINKTVEPAEFKVGRYARSLHDSYFRKWNDVK